MDFFQDFWDKMKILKVDLKSAPKISLTIREDFSILFLCEKKYFFSKNAMIFQVQISEKKKFRKEFIYEKILADG